MSTFNDIQYDTDYSQATFQFLLLYNQYLNPSGPSPVLVLPYASLMTFINVFQNLNRCQQHINNNNNNQKLITLAISDEQIIEWDNNNIRVSDNNIDKVHIFCENYADFLAMKKWDGCYRNKVQDVYLPDTLEFNLLKLGVDYIHKIMPGFRQDRSKYRKFNADANRLLDAMKDYFQEKVDSLDDELGEECQELAV